MLGQTAPTTDSIPSYRTEGGEKSYGQIAYETHFNHVGTEPWGDLLPVHQTQWERTANAVLNAASAPV